MRPPGVTNYITVRLVTPHPQHYEQHTRGSKCDRKRDSHTTQNAAHGSSITALYKMTHKRKRQQQCNYLIAQTIALSSRATSVVAISKVRRLNRQRIRGAAIIRADS